MVDFVVTLKMLDTIFLTLLIMWLFVLVQMKVFFNL